VKWKKLKKIEILENIIINPQCISINNKTELNSKEGNTIERIREKYNNFDSKIEELKDFIKKNHLFYGRNCLRQYNKTFLSNLGFDPVLVPKNFDYIIKGLNYGLEYIIKTDVSGTCPFLTLNLCSIHDFKPMGCKNFPYTKNKCLRKDNLFSSICSGLKKVKEA
jgi:Fe-S-cluster containining protein